MSVYPNYRCQRCFQPSSCQPLSGYPSQRPIPDPTPRPASSSSCQCNLRTEASDFCETYPALPENVVLAMAYVPWQYWSNLYSRPKAFQQGTIFVDLNKPFYGKGACCR